MAEAVALALDSTIRFELPGPPRFARDLARSRFALSPAQSNREVVEFFKEHPDQDALPIVEDDMPIGIINRSIFLTGYAQPYRREVYERKSCIAFMDKNPLTVDEGLPVAELGRLAVAWGGKVLHDGFLVTGGGRFLGLGTGLDLLQALGDLEAERNRVVRESIDYARLIQGALLATSRAELQAAPLAGQHLLWEPRDQVGGDAFFARRIVRDGRAGLFLALMDCTGHGVPGAFTAMLMTSFLGHVLDLASPWEPGAVLAQVNRRVKRELGQAHRPDGHDLDREAPEGPSADEGMDATCLWLEEGSDRAVFAGARHSLWLFAPDREGPEEIKGDRVGVGYSGTADDQVWTSHVRPVPAGSILLGLTDGAVDQIGGPRRIAFGRKRLWEAFQAGAGRGVQAGLAAVREALVQYQGGEQRRDDVSLFAVKV
jgi:serine phosphatase RsbU (regulator of sigma subunit)